MKKRTRFIVLSVSLILIILLLLPLRGHPAVYSRHGDIDINSGDSRRQTYLFSLLIKEEIEQTLFSREVRRLSIPVGEDRIWARWITTTLTRHSNYRYGATFVKLRTLIGILDSTNTSDQDRIAILQRALTALQKGNHREIEELTVGLYLKHKEEETSGPTLK